MSNLCDICCESYNNSTHSRVICEYVDCQYNACKSCVRIYLIGTTQDPNCMKCKKIWNEQFMVQNLNKSFCYKQYKQFRKNLLLDREISKLPETMIFAEQQKKVDKEQYSIRTIDLEIKNMNKQLKSLRNQKAVHNSNMINIRNGIDNNQSERRKFIMSCPHDGCRGFLSSQYKCELCEMFTCPHCLEIIGISKDIQHTCNPDSVASAEFIKKDTKPCPKCATRIHKIHGCNQMWCTQCHIAFDYSTLKIDTGRVHNPEYYRYLQQQGNGIAPRNPGDIICGGLIMFRNVTNNINPVINYAIYKLQNPDEMNNEIQIKSLTLQKYINSIHRVISHISFYELERHRRIVRDTETQRKLRIHYILGKITKDQLKDKLYINDINRKKSTEILHIYELLNVVGIETFNTIDQDSIKSFYNTYGRKTQVFATNNEAQNFIDSVNEKILAIDNLRDYANKRLASISVTYNHIVLKIQLSCQGVY